MIQFIIPIITGIAGFFLKMGVDYFWLKAPRISMSQKIKFDRHVIIPNTSNSEFSYTMFLSISNDSANEAYSFQIKGIEGPSKMEFAFYVRIPTKPITIKAGESQMIRLTFAFKDLTDNFFSFNLNNQLFMSHFASSTYVINYEFRNSLGKIYNKSRQYGFSNDFEENVI